MIAGGVAVVVGVLMESAEGDRLFRTGTKLAGGSVVVMGCGGLLIAAGGVSLATGIGIGAVTTAKGASRIIQAVREERKWIAEQAQHESEAGNCLVQTGEEL